MSWCPVKRLTMYVYVVNASIFEVNNILACHVGCEPMKQLYEILLKSPGVFGARFSGAGFRGCCLALVDARCADKAAAYVKEKYLMVQPKLASEIPEDRLVLICEPGGSAHIRENIQSQD